MNIFKIIIIDKCHHVWFHEEVSKIVPANFSFDFQGQGQRSRLENIWNLLSCQRFGSFFAVKRSPKLGNRCLY